ncbi:MAG: transporter related [Deltaproteobacteria bacterium]|nr:transporter related [Deltaproteobacteria bacterium]
MIRISGYHKTFNAGTLNEVYALRGIDLSIEKGEFLTVIGTNGSGKTTLLNAIAGTFMPDRGTIMIDGKDMAKKADFQRAPFISRVFQNPFTGTAPDMTIAENVHLAFMRDKRHLPVPSLTRARLAVYRDEVRMLEMQLEDRLDNTIGTLSGGQRQALTLLMAVMNEPHVLLLDEHTAALDPKSASQVVALTEKFVARYNPTTVMITHSMQQALEMGTRTILMHKGQIIEEITGKEKKLLTTEDLLDRFADLRKQERLTPEMIEEMRREYL